MKISGECPKDRFTEISELGYKSHPSDGKTQLIYQNLMKIYNM